MEKYLVYKATGGITHMLYGLSFAISIAKAQKRILVIDTVTGIESLKDNFNKFFNISLENLKYTEDFNIISEKYSYNTITLDEIKNLGAYYKADKKCYLKNQIISNYKYIKKNKNKNLLVYGGHGNYLQKIIYFLNSCISNLSFNKINLNSIKINFIKVNPSIVNYIEHNYKINKKFIAVHIRNTDIKNNILVFIKKIKKLTKKTKIITIYLSTDDYKAYNIIKSKIPNIDLIQFTKPYKTEFRNTHLYNPDKYQQTLNYLIDMYFILKSDFFIPSNNSGMSLFAKSMRIRKTNMFNKNFN